jgi:hypothetical protein
MSLTVKELIEKLQQYPSDMEVCIAESARDYWHTTLASPVKKVSNKQVAYKQYHEQYCVPKDEDVDQDDDVKSVILIN